MCGIWSMIGLKRKNLDMVKLFEDFMQLKHRGPDSSHFEIYNNVLIGFHRLAIVNDSFSGNQPFVIQDENRTVIFIANAEIYNYKEIIEKYNLSNEIKSDCFVIPQIYMNMLKNGTTYDFNRFIKEDVKGEFAFILYEFDHLKNLKKVIVGRDECGVRPLYYTPDTIDTLFFSSEIKGGLSQTDKITEFPPSHIFTYTFNELDNISCEKYDFSTIYDVVAKDLPEEEHLKNVQIAVLNSVRRRLSADKPLAFLLSGGIDSSIIASLSKRILEKPIRTFCCSIRGANGEGVGTDLKYARMVADHIGSTHTEVLFTPQEGLTAIPDVIRTIGSWCTTTVRASVIQYMVCKYIREHTNCKVVGIGEFADEVCSSYLFNWYAPNGEALDTCAKEYVKNIHLYDIKRADRCIAKWGLEARVPFSDAEFIKAYWNIPGEMRMPTYKNMEKWWLRKAFDGTNILPYEVLWRTKEAQSDGCSSKEKSWFQIIQEWVEDKVTDEEMTGAPQKYPFYTPQTKEAYYYRKIFCDIFGEHRQNIISKGYWQPFWLSNGQQVTQYIDPSARVLSVYNSLS
jgi:asparagine synthase (glutamine-hydrolysing)